MEVKLILSTYRYCSNWERIQNPRAEHAKALHNLNMLNNLTLKGLKTFFKAMLLQKIHKQEILGIYCPFAD